MPPQLAKWGMFLFPFGTPRAQPIRTPLVDPRGTAAPGLAVPACGKSLPPSSPLPLMNKLTQGSTLPWGASGWANENNNASSLIPSSLAGALGSHSQCVAHMRGYGNSILSRVCIHAACPRWDMHTLGPGAAALTVYANTWCFAFLLGHSMPATLNSAFLGPLTGSFCL